MPAPIARWNPERDVWETDQGDLFSGHLDVYSETWPRSGTWADGTAYELPTSAPPTAGSVSSSLLPTPDANMGNGGRTRSEMSLASGKHQANLNDLPRLISSQAPAPPTPTEPDTTATEG